MPSDEPWLPETDTFPANGSLRAQFEYLLRFAILAPSGHNTQPWLFQVAQDALLVFADRTRALPVVDPDDRELTISCGAAIEAICVSARHYSLSSVVTDCPDPSSPDLLASIRVSPGPAPTVEDERLFETILRRRTTRSAYDPKSLPRTLVETLTGLGLVVIQDQQTREQIAKLVAEGDRIQMSNARFRRELTAWIHSRRSQTRDGISTAALGMPDHLGPVILAIMRRFDMGDGVPARDEALASATSALVLIATGADLTKDWLEAGRSLMRAALEITAAGVCHSYLNQPIEVAELRDQLRDIAGISLTPQILLRVGYGTPAQPSARRSVLDVLGA
jgi:hypothetical protein